MPSKLKILLLIRIVTLIYNITNIMMSTNAFIIQKGLWKQIQNKSPQIIFSTNRKILNPMSHTTPQAYIHQSRRIVNRSKKSNTSLKWGEDNNNDDSTFTDENGRTIRKSQRSKNTEQEGGSSNDKWSKNGNDDGDVGYEPKRQQQRSSSGNKWTDSDYDFSPKPQNPPRRRSDNSNSWSNKGDSYGRKPQRPSFGGGGDSYGRKPQRPSYGGGGGDSYGRKPQRPSYGGGGDGRSDRNGYNRNERSSDRSNNRSSYGSDDNNDQNQYNKKPVPPEGRINLRELEEVGLEHVYGLSPVLNALRSQRRNFDADPRLTEVEEEAGKKLEAQSRPILFIQEKNTNVKGNRVGDKAKFAQEIETLAHDMTLPIAKVDKGVLNSLSGNRPHQGYVLRTHNLPYERTDRLQTPDDPSSPLLYLVMDEVVDPQNFGALLRSAYFLGDGGKSIEVVTCAKNSAPPSPTVSAASAGALEVMTVLSTSNLPRLLSHAKEDGWNVIGAAAAFDDEVDDTGESKKNMNLKDISKLEPTILVLGSEGFGLRTLVANCCSAFVRIGGDDEGSSSENAIDSLNVSVTGGIMMWHLMNRIER